MGRWAEKAAEKHRQSVRQPNAYDMGDGMAAKARAAAREAELIRQNDELIALQRETNRLLSLLVHGGAVVPPPPAYSEG